MLSSSHFSLSDRAQSWNVYNPANVALHNTIYNDPDAFTLVFDALENPGPADPERAR